MNKAQGNRKKVTNARYVANAFDELTGDNGTPKQVRAMVARLDAGALKVQVVEDIALTEHGASWWNKR